MDIQVEDTERGYGYIVFPAPREVDREIYQMVVCYQSRPPKVSGPSRGR